MTVREPLDQAERLTDLYILEGHSYRTGHWTEKV